MKIKYIGPRKKVAIRLSSRSIYYFGPENGYTQDMRNDRDVQLALRSVINKFITTEEVQKEVPKESVVEVVEKEHIEEGADVEGLDLTDNGVSKDIVIKKRRGRKPKKGGVSNVHRY